jgi:hypothetical protein
MLSHTVWAKMMALPQDWACNSYRLCANDVFTVPSLDADLLLGQFGVQRDSARRAYVSRANTNAQIAEHFGVHYMTVSRAVRVAERV